MEIPYTRDRAAFQGQVLGWGAVFLVEGLVIIILILVFAPTLWLKLLLTGAFIALLAWIIGGYLTAPARTRHRLTETDLEIRFGRTSIDIPLSRIVQAERVDGSASHGFTGQPTNDDATGETRITFSRDGLIRLYLAPPLEVPSRHGVLTMKQVLFNADNRDDILQALYRFEQVVPQTQVTTLPPQPAISHDVQGDIMAIEATQLSKTFGGKTVVSGIDLHIHTGEIYGFIGPNGAGKTTTLSMLVGLLDPASGIVRIAGYDLKTTPVLAKSAIGYVPDRPVLYETLTGREMLEFHAQMRGLARDDASTRIDDLLETLDLSHHADELCRTYSFGMRNKLSLAAAMLHQPQVLILDEPFNGLDPQTSNSLRSLIIDQAARGTAVLLSTHDLALVERMCHRVGVLERGRLIAEGAPAAIRQQAGDLETAFLALVGQGAMR